MRHKKVFAIMYRRISNPSMFWIDWGGRDTWMTQNEKAEKLKAEWPACDFWVLHEKLIGKYAQTNRAA